MLNKVSSKFLLIFLLIFFLIFVFSFSLFAVEGDSFLEEESYLTDLEFKRKYIRQWNSLEGLIRAYDLADNVYDKIFLVERLCFFLPDKRVFNFIISSLSYELLLFRDLDLTWKLRASIFRLLSDNKDKLYEEQKLVLLKRAKEFFERDKNNRVVVSCAFALVKLSSANVSDTSHRLFKRRTIAYLFSDRLFAIEGYSSGEDYLAWGITSASLELGDSFVSYALVELRKKGLGRKLLAFIDKAIRELRG